MRSRTRWSRPEILRGWSGRMPSAASSPRNLVHRLDLIAKWLKPWPRLGASAEAAAPASTASARGGPGWRWRASAASGAGGAHRTESDVPAVPAYWLPPGPARSTCEHRSHAWLRVHDRRHDTRLH